MSSAIPSRPLITTPSISTETIREMRRMFDEVEPMEQVRLVLPQHQCEALESIIRIGDYATLDGGDWVPAEKKPSKSIDTVLREMHYI